MKMSKMMAVLGVAAVGWAMNASADNLLSSHETVAVYDGVRTQTCLGKTGKCPWECGDSGEYADFSIKKYLKYEKTGEYGMAEQAKFSFQISTYKGKDNKQPAGNPKLLKTVNGLKPGDYVLLSWNHNYVNRNGTSMPERPVLKLEALSKDAAEKLLGAVAGKVEAAKTVDASAKKAEAGNLKTPASKESGEVTWEELKEIIKKGTVKQVNQTHSRRVSVTMVDGKIYHATESKIDEIFSFLRENGKTPATRCTE